MLESTVGQILVNDSLPEDLRDYSRVLDKSALSSLLKDVARKYPERYREISFELSQVGRRSAQEQGGFSFGARHLRKSKAAQAIQQKIKSELMGILSDESLTDQQRTDKIVRVVGRESSAQQKAVLEEAVKENNPLGLQVLSGSRGKPMNLASLLAADMLYSDHRDEVIPIPVLRSYSQGLTPAEYWAGTYGARRGIIATKFATQEAGFLSKQLNQAGHRLVVVDEDTDEVSPVTRGLIVDTDDMDNEGSLLAQDTGPFKRNTPLTPKILKQLKRLGKDRILVRSPLVGGSPEGGVYARDVGVREKGLLPGRGEQVGLQAAQALSEPISQGQLSAKHSGGVAGQEKAVGGFQYINQLIQTPKKMQGGAAHSTVDGMVQRVEPAPAGGSYVIINGEKHYVNAGYELKVKKGDEVEAGDLISDGIPNPAIITKYKGVGEGRRYFVREFKKAMASSGMFGHRRNIELLARGLINHVRLTEEVGEHVQDDIIPYSTLEHTYTPREGFKALAPKKAVGKYLERPVLHYTIGTKVRPSMLKDFDEFGVTAVDVHDNPPPFESHMVRGMYQLQHDPDWLTQMYGSGLKESLLESVARGGKSEQRGSSFVPSLATGTDFGDVPDRVVIKPQAPYALPNVKIPDLPDSLLTSPAPKMPEKLSASIMPPSV
jgi:DNA-directed RNA polymerase subunit beta'